MLDEGRYIVPIAIYMDLKQQACTIQDDDYLEIIQIVEPDIDRKVVEYCEAQVAAGKMIAKKQQYKYKTKTY